MSQERLVQNSAYRLPWAFSFIFSSLTLSFQHRSRKSQKSTPIR